VFVGPTKLKKTSTANTEMQIMVTIGVLGSSGQLRTRDHSAVKTRLRKWAKSYI
jgi:hypothetical protein